MDRTEALALDGLTLTEIAEAVGITTMTVRTYLRLRGVEIAA